MLITDLFDQILAAPVEQGADRLRVVSGYASPSMVFHHIQHARENGRNISVDLIVGMGANGGISEDNHGYFKNLATTKFPGKFTCAYVPSAPVVHSKVYAWCRGKKPLYGFVGSANYSCNAFRSQQKEAMAACDAGLALDYFNAILPVTLDCRNSDADRLVQKYGKERRRNQERILQRDESRIVAPKYVGLPSVTVSLLTRGGNVGARSGLNWGQRPEVGRNPDQGYIPLRAAVYNSGFFPPRATPFTVFTDDGLPFTVARAQDNGKAIHSPHDNSLIGRYFRRRLNVHSGAPVELRHLEQYGRTDVTFYKEDDETYHLDFSV